MSDSQSKIISPSYQVKLHFDVSGSFFCINSLLLVFEAEKLLSGISDTNSHLQLEELAKPASGQVLCMLDTSFEIPVIFSEKRRHLIEVYIREPGCLLV